MSIFSFLGVIIAGLVMIGLSFLCWVVLGFCWHIFKKIWKILLVVLLIIIVIGSLINPAGFETVGMLVGSILCIIVGAGLILIFRG